MRELRIEPILTLEEANILIDALSLRAQDKRFGSEKERALAAKLQKTINVDKGAYEARRAAAEAEAKLREDRAKNHVLTRRQAECLAAVRAGKGALDRPWSWVDDMGVRQWRWRYTNRMGGAANRMINTLIDEGLLTERDKLTEAGMQRLEAWEKKHGRIGGGV